MLLNISISNCRNHEIITNHSMAMPTMAIVASGHLHPRMRLLDLTGLSPGLLPSRLKKTATSPGEKAIMESCS